MIRAIIILMVLAVCNFMCMSAGATKSGKKRAELQSVVDKYLEAMQKGDTSGLPLASDAKYIENMEDAKMGEGLWKTPLKIDFQRTFIDEEQGETFSEIIVTDKSHPYVIGTRLKVQDGKIKEIEAIITDKGDWAFNANAYLKYSSNEKWDILAPESRVGRKELIAAADAYLDMFDKPKESDKVPWGRPCARLEGGVSTGRGTPNDRCDIGIPQQGGLKLVKRRYIVDEAMGTVDVLLRFGGDTGLVDSHMFRLENGKIRFIHTLTVLPEGFEFKPQAPKAPTYNN